MSMSATRTGGVPYTTQSTQSASACSKPCWVSVPMSTLLSSSEGRHYIGRVKLRARKPCGCCSGMADVNRLDMQGRTPLHDAVFNKNWTIVELLARADADWLSEDPSRHDVASPVHLIFASSDRSRAVPVREILERVAGESPQAQRALAQLQRQDEAEERNDQ